MTCMISCWLQQPKLKACANLSPEEDRKPRLLCWESVSLVTLQLPSSLFLGFTHVSLPQVHGLRALACNTGTCNCIYIYVYFQLISNRGAIIYLHMHDIICTCTHRYTYSYTYVQYANRHVLTSDIRGWSMERAKVLGHILYKYKYKY